jgi:beta-glucuronidase
MQSRRTLLASASGLAFVGTLPSVDALAAPATPRVQAGCPRQDLSLEGEWAFCFDPDGAGDSQGWHLPDFNAASWVKVCVPHTWQVTSGREAYRGRAWYRREVPVPKEWNGCAVRIEFEAVFHSARVWVNGRLAGSHLRKGYTAFVLEITPLLRFGADNVIAVEVDSSLDDSMLPRGRSSDWALDGGIYRPVSLLVSAPMLIEQVAVEAVPQLALGHAEYATVHVRATCRNTTAATWHGQLAWRVLEAGTGRCVLEQHDAAGIVLPASTGDIGMSSSGQLANPRLWHFDHPHLYTLELTLLDSGHVVDRISATFGVRSIEVRGTGIFLNGENVRLMGVERMAGSNPEFGMAETPEWIAHDHGDLKHLNCVFTRVHWQQDRRVLDYCDRHGILLQSEVPAWGYETFVGSGPHPADELVRNGIEQLREMIARDRNHPCIISWGLCNEVNGQHPPAFEFAQRLYAEAKRLDPRRLCSYASNSLEKDAAADVSGLMDFVECNEYFQSWNPGTLEDLRRTLQDIHRAFPNKPVVISEYGYCACVPERPEGDARRVAVLRDHTRVFREFDFIAGLIFFCYNDYRTHVGDKGDGATLQRVHGVVDLYGNRKPSYDVLREESSPVDWVRVTGQPGDLAVTIRARVSVPAYRMSGYTLRGVLYGEGNIPLERRGADIPMLAPGEEATVRIRFAGKDPLRIEFDVLRPTAFSAYSYVWHP